MMPKMDGFQVCKALKQDEKTSHIPIIMLTAKAAMESKLEGLELGADDYLAKPFEPKELLARAKNLIELRRKLREKFSIAQPLKPGEIAVTSLDDAFLQKAKAIVERKMEDEKFSVEELASEVAMSRMQLHRKLTALTNQPASEFIRYLRLHRAKQMLEQNGGNVSEVAYSVGFGSPAHFAKCFKEQFGVAPSEVAK
jgi:DNA-binding response OmpR family regulator